MQPPACYELIAAGTARLVMEPSARAAPTFLPLSLPSSGHRTWLTQPSFSASQIPRAAMSICPLNTPCLAHVGSAWCRNETRTRLAQKNAMAAPGQDIVHRPPIRAGSSNVTATIAGKNRWTATMSSSASQSGENFLCEVMSRSNSQPMCAQAIPLASAFQSSPNRQGECGSPSLSLYLWCLRWSETQSSIGPSIAIDPATPSATLKARLDLNDPCVK